MNNICIIIIIILLTIVYLEFHVKFTLLNIIPTMNNLNENRGKLFICSHNFEHKDIFIIFKLFEKQKEKFYMLFADKSWNYILEPFRPNNIEFIYVKENTVNKLSSKILLGKNVIMFLYNHSNSSGPFYILKNTNCLSYIIKIKRKEKIASNNFKNMNNKNFNNSNKIINHNNGTFTEIFMNNFMKEYFVNINRIKYKLSKFTIVNNFMNQLKYKLYS